MVQKQRKVSFLDERVERFELVLWRACSPNRPWSGLLCRDFILGRGWDSQEAGRAVLRMLQGTELGATLLD